MRLVLAYWLGYILCFTLHFFIYENAKECKQVDSVMMCRTVHYGDWKEVK